MEESSTVRIDEEVGELKRGYSGAEIEVLQGRVIKRGTGVGMQAHYMRVLGPDVCPIVWHISANGYEMQRCTPFVPACSEDMVVALGEMHGILSRCVWNFGAVARGHWKTPLIEFCVRQGFNIEAMLNGVYGETPVYWQRIHGDPTLANAMTDDRGTPSRLLISDPLMPKEKIPSLIEVDMAKMLQSVIGWERCILDWPSLSRQQALAVFRRFPPVLHEKIRFWLMVHLIRIIPYAHRLDVRLWAQQNAITIFDSYNRKEDPCYTLSILMER